MNKKPGRRSQAKTEALQLKVEEPTPLMEYLLAKMPNKSRDNIKSLLRYHQVLVDDVPVSQFNYPLQTGQLIRFTSVKSDPGKTYRGITIMYEDDDIIVIDKHAGILSVSTNKKDSLTAYSLLYDHVKRNNPDGKIFIVHRLDRDTSGVMLFAKSAKVQKILQKNWNDIIRERVYLALVEGVVHPPDGEVSSYLKESKNMMVYSSQEPGDGQWSVTQYKTWKTGGGFSLLRISLRTGRKNQIRVHMQDIGHPVTGDKKYGARFSPIGRMGLHAITIAFQHPVNLRELKFETAVPRKLLSLF